MPETRQSRIVPLMKARVPVELQLEFPLPPEEEPIREPFAGELYVSYALELPERFEWVAPRHCAELGLSPGELRERASANLRIRRPELTLNWYPDAKAVSVGCGGDLEAGLLLDDGFLEKLAQDVEGDLVVAVPARDALVASGTGHPDGLEKLRWAVDRVWSDSRPGASAESLTGAHPQPLLTRDLLVRRDGAWQVLPL
jgi:uncharacterized protein YtpQ (UPF0354 family)